MIPKVLGPMFAKPTIWLGGAAGLSLLLLAGSILLTPWLLSRLPTDYFQDPHHRPLQSLDHRPLIRIILLIVKNLMGFILFLAGISMLFLPGQGLLTIAMAMVLVDFPGKNRLKRSIIQVPRIREWINLLRERLGKAPFE